MDEGKKFSEGLHVAEYNIDFIPPGMESQEQIIKSAKVRGIIADAALGLAKHFAIVAAVPDGEDSAGRSKLRLMTPQEVVDRACSIAALLHDEFDARGWILSLAPPLGVVDPNAPTDEESSES